MGFRRQRTNVNLQLVRDTARQEHRMGCYEAQLRETRDEISEELSEYMGWGGNSGNDGWFYGDD
jgi:hypothetical protein